MLSFGAALIFGGGAIVMLLHSLVPIEQFIHRGDDAYYYFKVANNFMDHGSWTLDGIHSTTGVQPLWAVLLTGLASVARLLGAEDPTLLSRVHVLFTALVNLASAVALYLLLIRRVSIWTAVVASGTFLYASSIVWLRVWGMENSLYALCLLVTVLYFESKFMDDRTTRRALILGGLLALTMMARLNAVLLIPAIMSVYLWRCRVEPWSVRARVLLRVSAAICVVVVPYFIFNLASSGHLLPVSGVAKSIDTRAFLEANGLNRLSPAVFTRAYANASYSVNEFVKSRITGPLWVLGNGIINATSWRAWRAVALLGGIALIAGDPRRWFSRVANELRAVGPLWYVAAFGLADVLISVWLYPTQLRYAMTSWWFVEIELVLVVIASIFVGASLTHIFTRIPSHLRAIALVVALVPLVLLHGRAMYDRYWSDTIAHPTWNDEMYVAADWMNRNLPDDALVGSWNAGVLAYYSDRPVVNLDGLINDEELVTYLSEDRIADYIADQGIDFLSDLEPQFHRFDLASLDLVEVYSRTSRFGDQYQIFEVLDPEPQP